MIFLTVGTLFPFDRLVRAVDQAVASGLIHEEVFAQIGRNGFKPTNMEYVEVLNRETFGWHIEKASCLISHAGIGTIINALDCEKPLLVMPRLPRYKEHVNDHQVATARKFEQLGHILAAYNTIELHRKIDDLKSFIPKKRKVCVEKVVERISRFLEEVNNRCKK